LYESICAKDKKNIAIWIVKIYITGGQFSTFTKNSGISPISAQFRAETFLK